MKDLKDSRTASTARTRPARAVAATSDIPTPRRSDWKRMLLVAGLGILSWISTYMGMLELVQANMGQVDLALKIALAMSVAMLMLMIIWLLDQIFSPISSAVKLLFIGGYLFLSLISVGFGFGFYWKFLESRSEASRSAESAVTQVQSSLHGAETRLAQLLTTLDALTVISTQKAADEVAKGNSCPNSKPGDGPRRRLREADATRFSFAGQFVKERIGAVKGEVSGLDADLAKVVMQDKSTIAGDGTRNDFLRKLGRKLDRAVTGFNAFRTDPQLRQFRADFADRAEKSSFSDEQGANFTCPDPQLQTALRGVVKAIDQLPELENPAIAAVEGAEATIEAFRRLTATLTGALQFKLPPSADEIRADQQRAIQSLSNANTAHMGDVTVGLGKRDWIPLMIAVFVDICLLLVSFSRPMNRFQALVPKMREAQEWPVIEILSKFHGIHEDETIRRTFEVLRHVVFNWRGVYYAAVPLNGGSMGRPEGESAELEAYLLSNLFTSFERERIFRPVPVSMFTTGYVQKKLAQQRSKYAEVEGFRIYKFNNGAWPEMILGAVMGAAKRAEADQARLQEARLEAEAEAQKDLVRSDAARQIAEAEAATERAKTESQRLRAEADSIRLAAKSKRRVWPFGRANEGGREEPVLGAANGNTAPAGSAAISAINAAAAPAAATAATHPAYDVTQLVGELSMLMREQKAMIERQAATIEQLDRSRREESEPVRQRQAEIRVVEGGASAGGGAGAERPARTYFRVAEAAPLRPAPLGQRREPTVAPPAREPASITPIHPVRSAPSVTAFAGDVEPIAAAPAAKSGSMLDWAFSGMRGGTHEPAGRIRLGQAARQRVEPDLPALPSLAAVPEHRDELADRLDDEEHYRVEQSAPEPAVSTPDELEQFIASARTQDDEPESEHAILLGAPQNDLGSERDVSDLKENAVATGELAAAEGEPWSDPRAEPAPVDDLAWEDLEGTGMTAVTDERASQPMLIADHTLEADENDNPDWDKADIDHDSITKWWARGRAKDGQR